MVNPLRKRTKRMPVEDRSLAKNGLECARKRENVLPNCIECAVGQKKVLLKGQYSVQTSSSTSITTERSILAKDNVISQFTDRKEKKWSQKRSHQSLQTFFKIVSLFFSHFGNDATQARVFTGELESWSWKLSYTTI